MVQAAYVLWLARNKNSGRYYCYSAGDDFKSNYMHARMERGKRNANAGSGGQSGAAENHQTFAGLRRTLMVPCQSMETRTEAE